MSFHQFNYERSKMRHVVDHGYYKPGNAKRPPRGPNGGVMTDGAWDRHEQHSQRYAQQAKRQMRARLGLVR
jgi:hypothetical protein